MSQARTAAVDELIGALAGADSTPALYARLADVLRSVHSLPAILYVRQGEALHPVAGFDCSREVPLLQLSALVKHVGGELPANQVPIMLKGEIVGLLAIFGQVVADGNLLLRLTTLLAVKLHHLMHEEALRRELHLNNEQLAHLVNAGELLSQLDVEVLLRKILESVLGAVGVPVGAVVASDPDHPERPRMATWGMRDAAVLRLRHKSGRPIVEEALRGAMVLHIGREELKATLMDPPANLGGLLVLPLRSRGTGQGALVLASPHEITQAQRRLAETLGGFAAAALANALQVGSMVESERLAQELAIARNVQEAMYPTKGLACGGLRIEGSSRTCHETGGDYFTFLDGGGVVTALVVDVSGHGLGAALFATMAHAIVQHRLHSGAGILAASRELNGALCHAQSGRFLTCAMVEIDAHAHTFTYVSAGHCPLLWIHQGEVRWLESTGVPLGIMTDADQVLAGPLALAAGDMLVLYTDGVTEAANPDHEPFGDDRLAAAVQHAWRLDLAPAEVMMLVYAEVDAWSAAAAHEDDLTMVVIRVERADAQTATA